MPDGRHVQILYIEDEPFFSRTVIRFLEEAGYVSVPALDGESGLSLVKSLKPDLVLLDLILPKMQGVDVLREMKADPETKDIPVIVLSNLSSEKTQQELSALGALDYIVKATTLPSEIVRRVRSQLEHT